jgi:hypothetical protein
LQHCIEPTVEVLGHLAADPVDLVKNGLALIAPERHSGAEPAAEVLGRVDRFAQLLSRLAGALAQGHV